MGRYHQSGRIFLVNKYKKLQERKFYFTMNEKLWWSPAWQKLTPAAKNLFFAMISEARFSFEKVKRKKVKEHTNNGRISFCEISFKKAGLGASQTYLNARNQLIEVGFIKMIHRGGIGRGNRAKYQLLYLHDVAHHKMRWKRYPDENWQHEIPKEKNNMIGIKTRFKRKPTLSNKALNGMNTPHELDPKNHFTPNKQGR
tara:strand:- start:257 stop:853 length:597 start_codon:yes stop_codon:yes gene_type:complete